MKTKILLGAAFVALAAAAPAVLQAQQLPPAVIAVVNRNQVARDCTPCAAAIANLSQQRTSLQQFETQLTTPLVNERNAIAAAVQALPQGAQPDAALQQRMQTFDTNRTNASNQLTARGQQLERNQQYIIQQILVRMQPMIQQVANQRGASLTLDADSALVVSPQIDITPAVLALMNANTAAFSTTAPPPPATPAPATPTPAPGTPPRPRPQGR
jgi:Skp family chaperone for outer membrane proteins